jgi:hypothetical protein
MGRALRPPKILSSGFFLIALFLAEDAHCRVLAMAFKPPGPEERLQAIGPTAELPKALRLALDPGTGFDPIPPPRPGDWLAAHPEPGQTF